MKPIIMKNPSWACSHAIHVIRRRWPEAEPYIIKNSFNAYLYAKDVIKGR